MWAFAQDMAAPSLNFLPDFETQLANPFFFPLLPVHTTLLVMVAEEGSGIFTADEEEEEENGTSKT